MAVRLKDFIEGRVRRLRRVMAEAKLGALVVTDGADVRYLTGFSGSDSVLVLAPCRKVLVTDSRYVEQIRRECPGLTLHSRKGPMSAAVGEVLSKFQSKSFQVGIEADCVTVSEFDAYRKALGRGVKKVARQVYPLRELKDDWEVSQIRKSVRIAEASVLAALETVKIGMTEQELAARLDYEMVRRGGGPTAFKTIVAFKGHAAEPHAQPGQAKLKKGMPILIDWGATLNGYRSDLTRCWCAGRIPPAFSDAYRRVLEAQLAAIQTIKPGVTLSEVDAAARNVLRGDRYAFGHGTGHGIGLDIHEQPVLAPKRTTELQAGMVVTVEPGYYRPGSFGIRIEDDVLVTADGCRVLSRLDKTLENIRVM